MTLPKIYELWGIQYGEMLLDRSTWICPACGLEHIPGEHNLARCLWQMEQKRYEEREQ